MSVTGAPGEPDDGTGSDEERDRPEYGGGDYDGPDGFTRFCEAHGSRLERWYRLHGLSPEDAADVAQTVLFALSRAWPNLETDEHRRRYYYTTTKHKLVDFHRKQGRRVVEVGTSLYDLSLADLAADELATNPDAMIAGSDAPLWKVLRTMPEPQRVAVVGRHAYGMSYPELAAETGRSVESLRQDVARGLLFLRRAFKAGYCLLAALLIKVRRVNARSAKAALTSASTTALAVLPQCALLSLLLTTPLYVLPARETVGNAATALPRLVVLTLPQPVRDAVASVATRAPARTRGRLGPPRSPVTSDLLSRPPRLGVTLHAPVDPREVCLKTRCGTGDGVTVRVLGHEQALPRQSVVDTCPLVPAQAEPHLACSEGTEPP